MQALSRTGLGTHKISSPIRVVVATMPLMPRTARNAVGGIVYHVLNRGNNRDKIFRKPADYDAFVALLAEAAERFPGVRILCFCLMPNHWHLVLWPTDDGELSSFMRWLTNTHVRRYHQHYHTYGHGHVYQGRYKRFPIQLDEHLLAVLRYVEANAKRGKLVDRAERWRWCSLWARRAGGEAARMLHPWPVDEPADWRADVNRATPKAQAQAIGQSIRRGRPFGSETWVRRTAARLGLGSSLRPRGRPPKQSKRKGVEINGAR
jgi:putative transposase